MKTKSSSSQRLPFDTKHIMFALDSTYGNIVALEHLLTNYVEEIDEDDPKYDELDIKMGFFTYQALNEFKDELRSFKNFIKKYHPNSKDCYPSEPQGCDEYFGTKSPIQSTSKSNKKCNTDEKKTSTNHHHHHHRNRSKKI